MKNTKKLLVGVLSVAALLGTGVAAWTIGGGFTSKTETLDPNVIDTIGTRDIELNVAKKDSSDTIVFDSKPDLDITYTVKAVAAEGAADGFNPYDLTNYEKVAKEYQPDLTITTKAYDVTNPDQRVELKADDPFFNYVDLPDVQTIDYTTWLASEAGYDVTLKFAWSETYGNPQEYVDSKLAASSAKEQRTFIEDMIAALQNVQFEFVFEVKGVKGEDVPPVEEETGAVTLPEVAGSELSIEGLVDGKLPVGKHLITITTDEGKVVEGNLTVVENGTEKEVTLTESSTRAVAHTYTATYNFVKGATYSFKYEVGDEEVPQPTTYKVSVEGNENGTITVTDETGETIGATVNEGAKIKVNVNANEGFNIDTVTVGEEIETVNNSSFEKEYTVTSDLTISATYSEIKTEPEDPMANYEVFQSGRFGTYNKYLKDSYYFTGKMDSHYFGTSTNFEDGVVVTSYKDNENYYLRFNEPENKAEKYIAAEYNGGYYNILIQDEPYAWSYDETYNAYTAMVNNKKQFIGSYQFNTLSLQQYQYIDENSIAIITGEEIVVEATGLSIEASKSEVEVGKSITLLSTVTPEYAPGEVVYKVLEGGTGSVTLDGAKVTGVTEGEVQIVGKVGNVTSEPIIITVLPKSEEPVGTMTTTYTMLSSTSDSTYGDNHKFSDLIGEDGSNIDGEDIVDNNKSTFIKTFPNSAKGAKFGSGSATGELNFVLNEGYQLTAIEVSACAWKSSKGKIDTVSLLIGDNLTTALTEDFTVCSAEFNPGVTEVTIKGNNKEDCRYYIEYITFTYIAQ